MKKDPTHWFHMKWDEETREKLICLGALDDPKELPGFIVSVITKYWWLIEKHHFTGPNQGCRYYRIKGAGERKSLWLPFPEKLYQKLKSVHKDLDYYSIAQIVRKIIYRYIKMRKKATHEKLVKKLKWLQERWCGLRKCFRIGGSKKQSHMRMTTSVSKAEVESCVVFYNQNAEKRDIKIL